MFSLTRPHRQVAATVAIVIATMAPTVYVAATCWWIAGAGHLHEVEAQLGRRLGLDVSLEGVRYPRPRQVVYRGVVLRQEEPRRKGLTEVARAREIVLHHDGRELAIQADGLRLRGESPKLAMAHVGAMLMRPAGETIDRVSFSATACELDLGDDALQFSLRDVAGEFQADRASPSIRVSYRTAFRGTGTRCELSLCRDRSAEPVRTTLVMRTMEGPPLPAKVLDVFIDSAEWLGPRASVDGAITLTQLGAREWEAEFEGSLHDVELATLVGRRFPGQRLVGMAHLAIRQARWGERPGQGPGWIEAGGELTTGQGSMGVGLLHSLSREMGFRLPATAVALGPDDVDVEFRALGLRFEVCKDGEIKLAGALGSDFAPDVVVVGGNQPLAYAPRGAANVRGLIKTLIPTNPHDPVMVPLTDRSRVLLCFPAPPRVASGELDGNGSRLLR